MDFLASTSPVSGGSGATTIVFIAFLMITLYLLPSIIALIKRNHRTKVILFNIFLGWTFIMWIISLVWACKRDEKTPAILAAGLSPADELKKYKELLDSGAISEEEFEDKKNRLLEI